MNLLRTTSEASSNPAVTRLLWPAWLLGFIGCCALCMKLVAASPATDPDPTLEYKVKAGYLFNFARFVEWPAHSLSSTNSTITIGLLTSDPAAPILQQALSGKVANGRPLKVLLLAETSELALCHMFFFSRAEKGRLEEILKHSRGTTTTVGEIDRFAHRGGIINLVRKDESYRFEINLKAGEQAGLKISSKLAVMATIVDTQ